MRKGYRKKGVTEALIGAALNAARRAKAPALEAYPPDADLTPSSSSTGYASTFSRAGFKTVCAACRPARLCATIWRETGAKSGDFRLQTATIGLSRKLRSVFWGLGRRLPGAGSGRAAKRRSKTFWVISLDKRIGAAEERLRQREPKLLCRLQVEHQLEGRRLHYR